MKNSLDDFMQYKMSSGNGSAQYRYTKSSGGCFGCLGVLMIPIAIITMVILKILIQSYFVMRGICGTKIFMVIH